MAEGYCVKCKAKKEIANGVEETMKNGRKAIKGKCPTCGTVMFKILGGKAAPAATPATPVPPADWLNYVCITACLRHHHSVFALTNPAPAAFLSRLITRTGLDLAAMRMFAPSAELVKEYAETIVSAHDPQDRKIQELLKRLRPAKSFARPQDRPPPARHDDALPRR